MTSIKFGLFTVVALQAILAKLQLQHPRNRTMTSLHDEEAVRCPWCHQQFLIVPSSSASAFKCPHCGDSASLGSLRNSGDMPNTIELARASGVASAAHLYDYTVAYKFIHADGSEKGASGTVVQIGQHTLVATVAHAVPSSLSSIKLIRRSPVLAPEISGGILQRFARGPDSIDVAALVLEPGLIDKIHLIAAPIEKLADAQNGSSSTKARLIGYPSGYVVENYPMTNANGVFGLSYGCEPVEPERWVHITNRKTRLDASKHIVVEYHNDVVELEKPEPLESGLPSPFGMSGGGLWQFPHRTAKNEIWTPDRHRLIGIQSGWLQDKGFLIITQVIHWLRLVADAIPDTKDELYELFPRLRELATADDFMDMSTG